MTAHLQATVLVVEDEALVNEDVADALRDEGFAIVQAYNGSEALAVLEERPDIRVVFTDVNMPGPIDGIRLVTEIRQKWPQIEVLITSGHQIPDLEKLDLVRDHARFVPKPYPVRVVTQRIREIIAPAT